MQKNDWLTQRVGKFTASEIHNLLVSARGKSDEFGKTAMSYIKEKAAETLTGECEQVSSKAMEWGIFQEPNAIAAYIKRTGQDVNYYGTENPLFIEWGNCAGGSPDGTTETHLLEVKCPYRSVNHLENLLLDAETFKSERAEYYAQIQFNMLITNKSQAHFISYDPRMACEQQQLFILEINEDKIYQNILTQRIARAEIELNKIITKIINNE
jgi:hypothetical protein